MHILEYTFIQHALVACLLTSIITGIVGSIAVSMRLLFLTGAIAHTAYGGIGISFAFSLPLLSTTLFFTSVASIVIAQLSYYNVANTELLIAVLWAFGMALGIIVMDIRDIPSGDLLSFLFGSILTVSTQLLYTMGIFTIVLITMLYLFYPQIHTMIFDLSFAKTRITYTKVLYTGLICTIGIAVILLSYTVGLLIMIALLTIPVGIAQIYAKNFLTLILYTVLITFLCNTIGLVFAWFSNVSSGASIAMVAIILYTVTASIQYIRIRIAHNKRAFYTMQ